MRGKGAEWLLFLYKYISPQQFSTCSSLENYGSKTMVENHTKGSGYL